MFEEFNEYMFTGKNIKRYASFLPRNGPAMSLNNSTKIITFKVEDPPPQVKNIQASVLQASVLQASVLQASVLQASVLQEASMPPIQDKNIKTFIPPQKDKLFWCFYIILHGIEKYEIEKAGAFSIEKKFKIDAIGRIRLVKDKVKALKIKINEIEDELANKEIITVSGLQVLCMVYNVSVMYLSGKKYCEFLYADDASIPRVIIHNNLKEDTLLFTNEDAEAKTYNDNIHNTYWKIDNIQKPLNAPSAYTLKDLQTICEKLDMPTINNLGKKKTKQAIYTDILTKL